MFAQRELVSGKDDGWEKGGGALAPSAPLPGSRPRLSQAKMGAFAGLVCEIPADWTLASCCPTQTELQGGSSEWSGPQEGEMWEVSPHRWFPKWNQEELMGGRGSC